MNDIAERQRLDDLLEQVLDGERNKILRKEIGVQAAILRKKSEHMWHEIDSIIRGTMHGD